MDKKIEVVKTVLKGCIKENFSDNSDIIINEDGSIFKGVNFIGKINDDASCEVSIPLNGIDNFHQSTDKINYSSNLVIQIKFLDNGFLSVIKTTTEYRTDKETYETSAHLMSIQTIMDNEGVYAKATYHEDADLGIVYNGGTPQNARDIIVILNNDIVMNRYLYPSWEAPAAEARLTCAYDKRDGSKIAICKAWDLKKGYSREAEVLYDGSEGKTANRTVEDALLMVKDADLYPGMHI